MEKQAEPDIYLSKMMGMLLDALAKIPFFKHFNEEERKKIAKFMFFLEYAPGDTVFNEGDSGDYVCFVVDGALEVFKKRKSGSNAPISCLTPGHSLGIMAVLDDYPRSATVKASAPTRVVTLSRNNFNNLIDNHPRTGNKILKAIAKELSMHLRETSTGLAEHLDCKPHL
jgi:CRP-like cAMP-binding protein